MPEKISLLSESELKVVRRLPKTLLEHLKKLGQDDGQSLGFCDVCWRAVGVTETAGE